MFQRSEYDQLKGKIEVKIASQAPLCKHWVILLSGTAYQQDFDERYSNGYISRDIVLYHAYLDEQIWKQAINLLIMEGKREFRVMIVNPAQLEISTRIIT